LAELERRARVGEQQSKDGKPSKKGGGSDDRPEWIEDPWVRTWAQIEPSLAGEDLRPYLFITRDKKTILGASIAGQTFDVLIERLSGKSMAVALAENDVRKLTPDEALKVLKQLSMHIVEAGDFSKQPQGYIGMELLVKTHATLQTDFVQFLESLPIDKLGTWVANVQPGSYLCRLRIPYTYR